MNGIVIKNLTKSFKQVTALDDISLCFEEHKIYGLLGRNGAGKSTLLNIISERIFYDQGQVTLDGEELKNNSKASKDIFLMSETNMYPEDIKIKDLLKWVNSFRDDFDINYANNLAEKFGLSLNSRVKGLSTGYNSICKLVIALSINARFVFLDEPILGLDANHRDLFYKSLLDRYSVNESTYIISTHLIEEISGLMENVIIIDKGKILYNGEKETLLERTYVAAGVERAVNEFSKDKQVIGTDSMAGLKAVYIRGGKPNEVPEGITISLPDIQKLFIIMTNEQA